jgi:CBS domain-containing protein
METSTYPATYQRTQKELVCAQCGTPIHIYNLELLSPDDTCRKCHYHLRRCANCRHHDGIGCLLLRADQFAGVPGQHCPVFAYRT